MLNKSKTQTPCCCSSNHSIIACCIVYSAHTCTPQPLILLLEKVLGIKELRSHSKPAEVLSVCLQLKKCCVSITKVNRKHTNLLGM